MSPCQRGENSCQAVPRGATSLWWHNCRTQPCSSASFQCWEQYSSRKPCVLPFCIPGERMVEGRVKIRSAGVHAEGAGTAQHSTPLLHGQGWAGSWGPSADPFPGIPTLPEMSTRSRSSAVRPSASSWMATAPFRASASGRLFLAPSMTWILLCGFSSISLVR